MHAAFINHYHNEEYEHIIRVLNAVYALGYFTSLLVAVYPGFITHTVAFNLVCPKMKCNRSLLFATGADRAAGGVVLGKTCCGYVSTDPAMTHSNLAHVTWLLSHFVQRGVQRAHVALD